jgi:hypothetical protein
MVRMRGLLPLQTPTPLWMAVSRWPPLPSSAAGGFNLPSFPSPSSSSLLECESVEREWWTRDRGCESEWVSGLVLWCWLSTSWTGVGECGIQRVNKVTPQVYCMEWAGGPSAGSGGLSTECRVALTETELCQVMQMAWHTLRQTNSEQLKFSFLHKLNSNLRLECIWWSWWVW